MLNFQWIQLIDKKAKSDLQELYFCKSKAALKSQSIYSYASF